MRTCSTFRKGHTVSKQTREKIRLGNINKKVSKETKLLMSKAKLGRKQSKNHNKNISDGVKKKYEENPQLKERLREIRLNKITPALGKQEKQILDKIEKEIGLKILRQKRVVKYFLDGYIPEINVAIEIDENYHFDGNNNLRDCDAQRQNFIENELGCQFIRVRT